MDSSQNYADLLEPGVRMKKKKKMQRGENKMYDSAKAKSAEDSSTKKMASAMAKKMGAKWAQ